MRPGAIHVRGGPVLHRLLPLRQIRTHERQRRFAVRQQMKVNRPPQGRSELFVEELLQVFDLAAQRRILRVQAVRRVGAVEVLQDVGRIAERRFRAARRAAAAMRATPIVRSIRRACAVPLCKSAE